MRTSFWKTVPRKSLVGFLLGVFCIFTTTGFAADIMQMGRQSSIHLEIAVLLSGVFAAMYAFAGFRLGKNFWMACLPIFVVQTAIASLVSNSLPDLPLTVPMTAIELSRVQSRLVLDGTAIISAIASGYACFVYVSISEARRYARVHSEMVLATEIHGVLVPPINTTLREFEFCGRAVPSGEVGGDLIDVFQYEQGWIAYIADVSGHGVAPGVIMAMVKSAARMQLSSGQKSGALLERLNSILYPIKKPEMYATMGYLAWDGEHLEYSLAGHPAILHYHAATNKITELACSNLPVGMFRDQKFENATVDFAPGDLFLLLTDGVTEVTNKQDEEFGIAGVKTVLGEHAGGPLDMILESMVNATDRHGSANDDRSLLFVRSRSFRLS